ncbi:pyridoxamine 5'-phosphate oxidase family protein [Lysobacter sp. ESA13C]|uniref:2Fe-2S iron-sulfur cluster-binding protein n=1 Tax=Lysobacter sp. ESA13C TaxID=2862676 RepID=UPI001CC1329C|nr:pyridoxamine 5'-phosphate oxidase family protein [Lysobacter sp. ESA13C]
MSRAFADITFTPSVKEAQQRHGSREANRAFELAEDARDSIGEREAEFIAERDSFYQATVSETGWPYVQHRGGPAGFLKVLDAKTIGFADFRGNRQYLSVGNLAADGRISLILMDYPNRRRLKIWGRARIVDESSDAALIARLEVPAYRARVERGIVIEVEACDWNCPQHITPRYTEAEIERIAPTRPAPPPEEKPRAAEAAVWGEGPLELVVAGVRQLTARVRAYELRHPQGDALPAVAAGAHLRVPVQLDGKTELRHYSISSDPSRRDAYEIAVLREDAGRGASKALHAGFELGLRLRCEPARNDFALSEDARPVVLIAGGIGITPIKAMAHTLARRGQPFQIHYAGRGLRELPFLEALQAEFGERLTLYPADQGRRLDLHRLLSAAAADTLVYACGPARLIDELNATAATLGMSDQVRIERFDAAARPDDRAIEVELRRSERRIRVAGTQTILDALLQAGVSTPSDCRVGNCGTCAIKVLDGVPEHRDNALSAAEKERASLMCICVSRAHSEHLALDL